MSNEVGACAKIPENKSAKHLWAEAILDQTKTDRIVNFMVTQVISIIMIQFFGITLLIDLYLKNYVKNSNIIPTTVI